MKTNEVWRLYVQTGPRARSFHFIFSINIARNLSTYARFPGDAMSVHSSRDEHCIDSGLGFSASRLR